MKCYSCSEEIAGVIIWLGEIYDDELKAWPFHPVCADAPWPLFEVMRSGVVLREHANRPNSIQA